MPNVSVREAAQVIADDQLDMLVELGGSTHMNRLDVMAFRPAPIQASWLGYPHSAGLTTIDYLVLDPFIRPERSDLLIEQPLMLKQAWYPLAPAIFREELPLELEPPVARNGYVTFGAANNPQKYSREVFRTWAQVMNRCPGSRFLFIRPEGGSASFRANVIRCFEAEGVEAGRILFEPVRGAHLPHYNRIDLSLDAFPQTGGTTTCESLWMGAPCVTLVGEAPFERLSYSVLTNLGLGDLCAWSLEAFVDVAAGLAQDTRRLAALRAGMRERMRSSPLGRTSEWARDFYDVIAGAVQARAEQTVSPAS
jgi:protein O-GlcNAc transferase